MCPMIPLLIPSPPIPLSPNSSPLLPLPCRYPGGLKETVAKQLHSRDPTQVLRKAVSGMLPKNNLRKKWLRHLHLFPTEACDVTESSLLTPYSSLFTPHLSLLTSHSSLLTLHSSLLTPHSSLLTSPMLNTMTCVCVLARRHTHARTCVHTHAQTQLMAGL